MTDLEKALGTPADKLKACLGARKFVLRVVPELGYLFGVPALLKQRQSAAEGEEATLGPALTKLGACVRFGYQTYELRRSDSISEEASYRAGSFMTALLPLSRIYRPRKKASLGMMR